MEEWNKIFEINKKLDEEFIKKCNCNSEEYYKKNVFNLKKILFDGKICV